MWPFRRKVIDVYGMACRHVRANVYEIEGVRYVVDVSRGSWKCLACGAEGMTSRTPSLQTVLENLSGHHFGQERDRPRTGRKRRAEATPIAGLVDNADGTLTDHASELMWQKDDDGVKRMQEEALAYCESLSLGGFEDWRLPELDEFTSLKTAAAACRKKVSTVYSPQGDVYWTATDAPPSLPSDVAYTADGTTMFRTNKYYVRAVRFLL